MRERKGRPTGAIGNGVDRRQHARAVGVEPVRATSSRQCLLICQLHQYSLRIFNIEKLIGNRNHEILIIHILVVFS